MKTLMCCRVCAGDLIPILSLGELFVSNFPLPGESDGLKAPLELVLCSTCHLLQLKHTVPADDLYRNYWYRSGTNRTMRMALADIANKAETLIHLEPGDAVLDIGCNDGTLLASYNTPGIFRAGFDPAMNLAPLSLQVADHVVVGLFEGDVFLQDGLLCDHRPKVITSIAMFYDLDEPKKFVQDIKTVMHPDGVWVVQMSYLPLMLRQHELGNICHEHLEYYSLQSFEYLLNTFDLEIVDVELNDVNGGSLRAYIRNRSANVICFGDETYRKFAKVRVQQLRDQESKMKLGDFETYSEFRFWIERLKSDVVTFIQARVNAGQSVYVYGASTKGNTLLQYFGLDHSLICAASERNSDKWGRWTVGTHIPILSEDQVRQAKPDYLLVLPWHFIEEFKQREMEYLVAGGRFILPAPHFTLI